MPRYSNFTSICQSVDASLNLKTLYFTFLYGMNPLCISERKLGCERQERLYVIQMLWIQKQDEKKDLANTSSAYKSLL